MDLRAHLLELVRPYDLGDEVCEGYALARVSTELGVRLTLRSGEDEVHVEVAPFERGRPHAARSEALAFSYRSGRADAEAAREICVRLANAARANEGRVLRAMQSPATDRVREVECATLLEPMGDAQRFFGLSPYVGCLIGCKFCYAQSRLAPWRRLRGLADVPWGSWVDVRINAAEVLRAELAALDETSHAPIKFCPIVSDPYHALEARYRLTRACLEALVGFPKRVFVLTRSASILEDMQRIAALRAPSVGVSFPTDDDSVRAHFEPRACSIDARLEILRRARELGIATFAVVQPMLMSDPASFARTLGPLVDSASLDVLRGEQAAGAEFDDPRFDAIRGARWQDEMRQEVAAALRSEGVTLWEGELPPESSS